MAAPADIKDPAKVKAQVRETFERIADSFDATRRRPWPEVLDFAESLPSDSLALDLGCGNGRHSLSLASRGHRVVGVDFALSLIRIARRAGRKEAPEALRFVYAELGALPLRDATADAACCIATLHHLPTAEERLAAAREMRRVLRAGAQALVSVWAMDQPRFFELLEEKVAKGEGFGDVYVPWKLSEGEVLRRYYHLFAEGELGRLLAAAGFEVENEFRSRDNHFAVVGR